MGMLVYLQGKKVDAVSTAAGQVVTKTYTVTVTGKQLLLEIKGANAKKLPWAAIDAMTVSQVVSQAPAKATVTTAAAALAFAPATAAVASASKPASALNPAAVDAVDPSAAASGGAVRVAGPTYVGSAAGNLSSLNLSSGAFHRRRQPWPTQS